MKTILASIILTACVSLFAQKTPPSNQTGPQNVYYQSWEEGEIKSCSTFSGQPSVIECDGTKSDWYGSFMNIIGNNAAAGMSQDEAYNQAFSYLLTHSRQFVVAFSENPWPKPQSGRRMAMWNCRKGKVISCKLVGRATK